MHYIASKIIDMLAAHDLLRYSSKEIYVYGLDLAIYTMLSTLGLFFIGLIASRPLETIILIAIFYTNQSLGGGFHASSHLKCFITMSIGTIFFLLSFLLPYMRLPYIILAAISVLLLWYYPLVLHPNKKFLANRASQFVIRSRRATFAEAALFLIIALFNFPYKFIQPVALSFFFSAISRCIAVVQHKELSFR